MGEYIFNNFFLLIVLQNDWDIVEVVRQQPPDERQFEWDDESDEEVSSTLINIQVISVTENSSSSSGERDREQ